MAQFISGQDYYSVSAPIINEYAASFAAFKALNTAFTASMVEQAWNFSSLNGLGYTQNSSNTWKTPFVYSCRLLGITWIHTYSGYGIWREQATCERDQIMPKMRLNQITWGRRITSFIKCSYHHMRQNREQQQQQQQRQMKRTLYLHALKMLASHKFP